MKPLAKSFEAFSMICIVDADEHTRAAIRLAFYSGAHATLAALSEAEAEDSDDDVFARKVNALVDEVEEFEITLGGNTL